MEPGQMSRGAPPRANREGKQNMVGASAPAGRKPEPSVKNVFGVFPMVLKIGGIPGQVGMRQRRPRKRERRKRKEDYEMSNEGCGANAEFGMHEYSEKTCPKCGQVFCWNCCGKTNVHEGGKYEPDFMECPACGYDFYSE